MRASIDPTDRITVRSAGSPQHAEWCAGPQPFHCPARSPKRDSASVHWATVGSRDDYRIDDGDHFVRVALHCRLDEAADVDRMLRAVDAALARSSLECVMFDVRGIEGHGDVVREGMWTWAAERGLRAVAVVVDGEMTRVRTNMTALSRKVRLRAFLDEHEAALWIRQPGRRTREIPSV